MRIYVPLQHNEVNRLVEIARAERRRPADQAAFMLSRLLSDQQQVEKTAEVAVA